MILKDIKKLEDIMVRNEVLERRVLVLSSPAARTANHDEMTHFFTGLPSYAVFSVLLSKLGLVWVLLEVDLMSGMSFSCFYQNWLFQ